MNQYATAPIIKRKITIAIMLDLMVGNMSMFFLRMQLKIFKQKNFFTKSNKIFFKFHFGAVVNKVNYTYVTKDNFLF